MSKNRLTAWLRPALTLFALAGMFSLAACGGGNGAPNNMFAPPAVTPTLAVLPATVTAYSGVPTTITITSGTAPFSAFSSDTAVLPVPSTVSTTIPLLPATVATDQTVTITIRDARGNQVDVPVTVHPSLLLPASITIIGNPVCGGSGAQLCSGQDGTATVKVAGAAGAPLAGRQIKFDVVLGDFSLIAANSATPAQTVTVMTDQNGVAAVTIRVPASAITQFGTIRATDVATGSSVIGQFTIAQFVNGSTVLTVIPTGVTTFTGPDTAHCASGGIAAFYIFGGTPPYTVQTNFPTALTLTGVPVLTSGGSFLVSPTGGCFTGATFAITDAAGRLLLNPPTVDNVLGTAAPLPGPVVLNPPVLSPGSCPASAQLGQILASGGTGTFIPAASGGTSGTLIVPPTSTGQIAVSVGATASAHGDFSIVVSSGSQQATATVHCGP
ncbi:MAG: hypothetical protein E6H71_12195 [Betaproteobacteria bacterium]|nr:MAG: hypothetical protein E6H71_12195 [Betaproteobacteria bacterium]